MKKITSLLAMAALATSAFAEMVAVKTYELPEPKAFGDWTAEVTVPNSLFADLDANSVIRVNFQEANAEGQVSLVAKVGDDWEWTQFIDAAEAPLNTFESPVYGGVGVNGTTYTKADIIASLKDRGMTMKGQNHTVVSVQLMADASTVVNYSAVATYTATSPVTFTWSDEPAVVPGSYFTAIQADSKIEINYTPGTNPQIQLAVNDPWTQIGEYFDMAKEDNVFTVKMAELATLSGGNLTFGTFKSQVTTGGLYIKGNGFTFNGLTLLNPTTDGINEVAAEAIDFNAPVEIYNLQGIRVNEMVQGNLYIVRQGNVVKKMVK